MKKSFAYFLGTATIILFGDCSTKSSSTTFTATMTATIGANSFTSNTTGAVQGTIGRVNDLTITGQSSSILITIDVWGYNNATGSFPINTTWHRVLQQHLTIRDQLSVRKKVPCMGM